MKKFRWDKNYLYWGMTAFCVIIACITFFMLLQRWPQIRDGIFIIARVMSPIFWGFALTYLLNPLLKTLEKYVFGPFSARVVKKHAKKEKALARALSVLFSVLAMSGVVIALLCLVLPQLYVSIQNIVSNLSTYSGNLIKWIEDLFSASDEAEEVITSLLHEVTTAFSTWVRDTLLPQMGDVVSMVTGGVFTLIRGIMDVFIGVIIACYLLYNKESFGAQVKKALFAVLKPEWSAQFLRAVRFTDGAFTGFISGKILDSFIIGVLCYIGCALLKIPYPVLISVLVGVTNIIPFFGPFIGAVPCAVILLMISPVKCLVFVIFILILQQIDGNIIGPKILGNATGLNGFWVMFAILVGGGLFGFPGMICGVPVFTVLYAGIRSLVDGSLKKRGLPQETARYVNVEELMGHVDEWDREENQDDGEERDGEAPETPEASVENVSEGR